MTHAVASAPERRHAGARLLVVDADEVARLALSRTLTNHGYAVTAVGLVDEAIRLFGTDEFEVAVLDIGLPKTTGVRLLEWIRGHSPRTQTVMLSAHASIEMVMDCIRAGAFDFLEKPYNVQKLIHMIEGALAHRKVDHTSALVRAGQIIFTTRDFTRLPEAVVKVSMDVMSADAVMLLLPGIDEKFYIAHAFGLDPRIETQTRIAVGEGIAGRVALERKALVINGDVAINGLPGSEPPRRAKSSIVYPLVMADRVAGIITFNRWSEDLPYREADLETAAVLASQVMLALENARLARQSATSEKLAAVGQLAAGVAHEINTPLQFVTDSLQFLTESFAELTVLVDRYEALRSDLSGAEVPESTRSQLRDIEAQSKAIDLAYLLDAMPKALARTSNGLSRVAEIVRAIKEFGRPDSSDRVAADLKQCLQSTLTVCRNEYKYVADIATEFGDVPTVICNAGELNQVFLNLIVNAAHAIADIVSGTNQRGKITIRTYRDGPQAVVTIEDTGGGIPEHVRSRIFDPFFTTKAVGRGTGLGLSIARTIVEKHRGSLTCETEVGRGTKFMVCLPFEAETEAV